MEWRLLTRRISGGAGAGRFRDRSRPQPRAPYQADLPRARRNGAGARRDDLGRGSSGMDARLLRVLHGDPVRGGPQRVRLGNLCRPQARRRHTVAAWRSHTEAARRSHTEAAWRRHTEAANHDKRGSMQRTDGMKATLADVVAEQKTKLSPGRVFVEAYADEGRDARVEYDTTITDGLSSLRRKPRYPARNMFKIVNLSKDPRRYYWHENPPQPGDPAVTGAALTREAASRFHRSPVPELFHTTAWVQVPPDISDDPETFESFINYRLIIRLATAENHTIIRGAGGLLNLPGIARITSEGPFGSTILAACNGVEQMGGTADGLIINPADYYTFMGGGRLMDDLEQHGVFVVRTRLVDPGTAIVGDFGHGAVLFDAGRSLIRFAEPPPGTFAEPGTALMAEIYERVVVNLPTNFFVVSL